MITTRALKPYSRVLLVIFTGWFCIFPVFSETLNSTNYTIKDVTLNASGVQSSTSYSLIGSFNPIEDARTSSGSYYLKAGFPNGIIANVPQAICFETTTTSGTTTCTHFPNANGAQGECGYPGCYDRAKLEIDAQSNPTDTLYLVKVLDVTHSITYYLKSDHTLSATYTISNFMSRCAIEGIDPNLTTCDGVGDPGWNASLQRYNVLGLIPNTQYTVSISALSGNFTGTDFGPTKTATTSIPTMTMDLDTGDTSNPAVENSSPYTVGFGELTPSSAKTATKLIWVDLNTNSVNGINLYIKDLNNGLYAFVPNSTIPSESEDLATDPNANGGFGLKTYNYSPSQSALGPLIRSATYDTAGANQVGAVSTSTSLLFYTQSTGGNSGPITGGRGAVYVKGRSAISTPTGSYSDTITFTLVPNL